MPWGLLTLLTPTCYVPSLKLLNPGDNSLTFLSRSHIPSFSFLLLDRWFLLTRHPVNVSVPQCPCASCLPFTPQTAGSATTQDSRCVSLSGSQAHGRMVLPLDLKEAVQLLLARDGEQKQYVSSEPEHPVTRQASREFSSLCLPCHPVSWSEEPRGRAHSRPAADK